MCARVHAHARHPAFTDLMQNVTPRFTLAQTGSGASHSTHCIQYSSHHQAKQDNISIDNLDQTAASSTASISQHLLNDEQRVPNSVAAKHCKMNKDPNDRRTLELHRDRAKIELALSKRPNLLVPRHFLKGV